MSLEQLCIIAVRVFHEGEERLVQYPKWFFLNETEFSTKNIAMLAENYQNFPETEKARNDRQEADLGTSQTAGQR